MHCVSERPHKDRSTNICICVSVFVLSWQIVVLEILTVAGATRHLWGLWQIFIYLWTEFVTVIASQLCKGYTNKHPLQQTSKKGFQGFLQNCCLFIGTWRASWLVWSHQKMISILYLQRYCKCLACISCTH